MSSATDPEFVINEYVELIQPDFVVLIASTAFSASLFTLLVVLLALSTKESRRRLVFRLNVFAICIALPMGILIGFNYGKAILNEIGHPWPAICTTEMAFIVFAPLLSDSILLTRLFALYPLSGTGWVTLLKIFTFPFCIKCARIVVLTLFLDGCSGFTRTLIGDPLYRNPKLIAEWAMQIADNMYSVGFFLYNLHVRTGSIVRPGGMQARIRQIFYISAANFVLPLTFSIALIILFMTIPPTSQASFISGLMLLINSYVTVMGVLCATVWFSGSEWVRTRDKPLLPSDMFALKQSVGRVHGAGLRHGSDIVVVGERSATPNTDCKQPTILVEEGNYCTI